MDTLQAGLSVSEAAAKYKVPPVRIREAVRNKELRASQMGGVLLVEEASLEAWLAPSVTEPVDAPLKCPECAALGMNRSFKTNQAKASHRFAVHGVHSQQVRDRKTKQKTKRSTKKSTTTRRSRSTKPSAVESNITPKTTPDDIGLGIPLTDEAPEITITIPHAKWDIKIPMTLTHFGSAMFAAAQEQISVQEWLQRKLYQAIEENFDVSAAS